jgi:chromosome segregation ATPase
VVTDNITLDIKEAKKENTQEKEDHKNYKNQINNILYYTILYYIIFYNMSERRVSSRPHQPSLAFRTRTLFKKITKFKTIIANLDNDISRFSERATLANNTAASARERIHYLTQEITRRNQEETEGNFGNTYARSLRHYNDYTRTNPTDVEGIRSRYNETNRVHGTLAAYIQENITPLRLEAQSLLRTLTRAQKKYITLNEDIVELTRQKNALQNEVDEMNSEYLSLTINENIARGKKQHRSTYKKRKRGQKR